LCFACSPQERLTRPTFEASVASVHTECNKSYEDGNYESFEQTLQKCIKPKLINTYVEYSDARDIDLYTKLVNHEINVYLQLIKKKISVEQASSMIASNYKKVSAEIVERDKKRQKDYNKRIFNALAEKEEQKIKEQKRALEEQKKLQDYYKKNPHEYNMLILQMRQLEAIQEQNQIMVNNAIMQDIANQQLLRQRVQNSQTSSRTVCAKNYFGQITCETQQNNPFGVFR
jgi:hypothetical protein